MKQVIATQTFAKRSVFCAALVLLVFGGIAHGDARYREAGEPTEGLLAQVLENCRGRLRAASELKFVVEVRQTRKGVPLLSPGTYDETLLMTVAMSRDGRVRVDVRNGPQRVGTILWDGRRTYEVDYQRKQWTEHDGRRPMLFTDKANQPKRAAILGQFLPSWLSAEGSYCARLERVIAGNVALEQPSSRLLVLRTRERNSEGDVTTELKTTWRIDAESGLPAEILEEYSVRYRGFAAAEETTRFRFRDTHVSETVTNADFEWRVPAGLERVETASRSKQPALGAKAPEAMFQTLDGRAVRLSEFLGNRYVLLVFWATWCTPCKAELRDLEAMLSKEGLAERVVVLAINIDSSESALRSFLSKRQLKQHVLLDGKDRSAQRAFGVVSVPTTFLLDNMGTIVGKWSGWNTSQPPPALEEIRQLVR